MKIKVFTTGGTIDKIYFDSKDTFTVGDSVVGEVLRAANVDCQFECESLLRKDSLDMTEADRQLILERVASDDGDRIILTHGTDTMVKTARKLLGISGKVIVLTGSMAPARFKSSDAEFNIGFAIAAVQLLTPGVYIAMNGLIFDPLRVRKNVARNKFENI